MTVITSVDEWSGFEPRYAVLLGEDLNPEAISDWLFRWSELEKSVWEGRAVRKRAKYRDANDAAAQREYNEYVEDVLGRADAAGQALIEKLLRVEGYEPAPEHRQMLRRLRDEADLYSESNASVNAELSRLEGEYARVIGSLSVTVGGEDITLREAERLLSEPDRDDRERVWRAVQERWHAERETLGALFLEIVRLRRTLATNVGLPDYRAYRWRELGRLDYSSSDCLALHDAIEAEIVPLALRLRERRRDRLGLITLRPWDLAVNTESGSPLNPFSDASELENGVARIFERLDPQLAELFGRMRPDHLDLPARRGKLPGSEEWLFPQTGLPYIHMNAVGTHKDVLGLLHESGHAFHDLLSSERQELFWNFGAPTEFEEFAAVSMEVLSGPHMERDRGGFYSPEDARRARAEHLESFLEYLPTVAMVDAFQHWVYAEASEDARPEDLDAKWEELHERFLPGTDWHALAAERAAGWRRNRHLYLFPLYYIEYAVAQLGAIQTWANMSGDRERALAGYREALAVGNTWPLPELFAVAGVRLPFEGEVVREAARLLTEYLGLDVTRGGRPT